MQSGIYINEDKLIHLMVLMVSMIAGSRLNFNDDWGEEKGKEMEQQKETTMEMENEVE